MSPIRSVQALLTTLLLLGLTLSDARAYNNEWTWKLDSRSTTFPTKTQAVAYMQSLSSVDARYPLLTEEIGDGVTAQQQAH
jgi:hypothetical protein